MFRTAIALPRVVASVSRLRQLLDRYVSVHAVTQRCRDELALLVTEASTNAVVHGRGDAPIEVVILVDGQQCVLEISNRDGNLDERRFRRGLPAPTEEHGRGLPIIGALADAVHVRNPRPGWVTVRIVKRLEHATG